MAIEAQLFDGTILEFPDGTDQSVIDRVAREETLKRKPPPSTERTGGEAVKDIGASLVRGAGALLEAPGQLVRLVPGLQQVGEVLAIPGEALSRYGESLKSEGLKVREALRSEALSEAEKDGILSQFVTAITSTIKDPALLSTFFTEQIPLLLGPGLAARATKLLTAGRVAGMPAAEAAAQMGKYQTRAAIGTGAAMQAADISGDAFTQAYEAAIQQGMSPEQANQAALNAARIAGAGAGAASLATTAGLAKLGGATIERRLAGVPGTTRARGLVGEAGSESLEESAGQVFSNIGVRTVDPTQSLTEGVGTAAGLGALGGAFFGSMLAKPAQPELAPGQRPGETLEQTAQRLQREVMGLTEAPEVVKKPSEVFELSQDRPALEAYRQELTKLPDGPEKTEALKVVNDVVSELVSMDRARELAAAEPARAQIPVQILSDQEIIDLASQPIAEQAEPGQPQAIGGGYAGLLKYRMELQNLPKSPERDQAIKTTSEILDRLNVEEVGRRLTPPFKSNIITETDLTSRMVDVPGFKKGDPLYNKLIGKDLFKPEDADQVVKTLDKALTNKKLSDNQIFRIQSFKDNVEQYLETVPESRFLAAKPVTPAGGEGVQVPAGGPAKRTARRPAAAKRPGVDVTQPATQPSVAGEAAAPAAVAPAAAPEVKPSLARVAPQISEGTFRELERLARQPRPEAPPAAPKPPTERQVLRAEKVKQLNAVLKKILSKYGLKDTEINLEEGMEYEGFYLNNLIRLALDVPNPVRVLRHESIHALKELGFFTPNQWKVLTDRANKEWIEKYLKNQRVADGRTRYDAYMDLYKGDMEKIREEAIADAFGDMSKKPPPGMMGALVKRIKDLFRAIKEALNIQGYKTSEEIFGAIERGKLKPSKAVEAKKPEEARPSLRSSIGFYSALNRGVDDLNIKASPAAGWKSAIQGLVNKGQVKADEVEWSGVNDWLDLQTGKVSKDDLKNYLGSNGIQVSEVQLGGPRMRGELRIEYSEPSDTWSVVDEENNVIESGMPDQDAAEAVLDSLNQAETVGTKYDQYTLPGGRNYREVLLMLPTETGKKITALQARIAKYQNQARDIRQKYPIISERPEKEQQQLRMLTDLQDELYAQIEELGQKGTKESFQSRHWAQPNVLAHIRLNDREDSDGKKVLFVEEIQSDWAQEGRKKGFKATTEQRVATSANRKEGYWEVFDQNGNFVTNIQDKDFLAPPNEQYALYAANERLQGANVSRTALDPRVIAAPFVTKTEGWLNLALKRIMVMAAEGGYDKVAFVNGDQSADRYDLSKQVDKIVWNEKTGDFAAQRVDRGETIKQQGITKEKLADIIGKEPAERLINAKEFSGWRSIEGDGLKVGGEGMTAFYDKIVPSALKKLLPKVGGTQLESVNLLKDSMQNYDRKLMRDDLNRLGEKEFKTKYAVEQPGFDVTPAMKQKVEEGLPMFSLRSLREELDPDIISMMDRLTVPRDKQTFPQRILEATGIKARSKFRAQALNRYNALAEIDRRVAKQLELMGGPEQLADSKAESAALMSDLSAGVLASALGVHDRIGGIPVFRNGITTISNQDGTVKGPIAIFEPLAKYNDPTIFQMYQTWAIVKRGSRLSEKGKDQNVTQTEVDLIKKLEQDKPEMVAEFKEIQKEWIKYNDGLVKYMQDTGVITPEAAKEFTKHGDYFPFYRFSGLEEDVIGPSGFSSIARVKQPKAIKGKEGAVGDFFEVLVRNSQAAINSGMKNIAAQRAVKQAEFLGEVIRLPDKPSPMQPNDFRVLENGEEVYYRSADPLFIDAIQSLNLPDLPFLGLLSKPAEVLRNFVTKDPAFMLANMMRDSLSAWVTTGVKMTPIAATIRNFGQAIAGTSPEYMALINSGVLGGYDYSRGVKQSGRELEKQINKINKTRAQKIAAPFTGIWAALEKGTFASDAATRMEIYKKTLEETGNEAEALWRSLEVMNFNRHGSSPVVRVLTAAVPFLNARMQGLDILYRTAIAPWFNGATNQEVQRMKTFWVRGMTLMALSSMYWALTHDDDEYKKQEQETRDQYWLFPSAGIKIPIPFEVGVMFKVIPERILEYTFGSDTGKDFLESMGKQLLNTFAFNPIPQVAKPIIEAATNYSFFTMRPIVGQGLEGVEAKYQVGPGTTRFSELVGQQIGLSPAKLDALIQGYTGTMGMYAMNLFDMIYDMNSESPKASKRFEQMPVLRRFLVDPEARGQVTSYYDLKNSVDEVVRTSNYLERTMDFKEYGKYMQENMKMLAVRDYINDLEKTMKEFREMKNTIRVSQLSADAKRDSLKAIGQMESSLVANIQTLKKIAQ
jgi:hypothetical protein